MAEAGWDGVQLGGNFVAGVALGKCVEFGYEYADQIAGYLQQQQQGAPASSSSSTATPETQDAVFV